LENKREKAWTKNLKLRRGKEAN